MSSFDLHGFWLFGNDGTRDEEEQEKEHQEELCRLMEQYHAYMDIVKEKSYVLRGTKIGCQYGRDIVSLDMYKDNGVVWGITKFPMATIDDCRTDNIHHFGYCKCPETQYAGRLPMTKASWGDGEITEAERGNIFPHICVPLIKKEQKWKQIDNDLLIEVGQEEYESALLEDAVLVCQYGGIIRIVEVPDVTEEEERKVVDLTSWLKAYEGEPNASNGKTVTYSFEDRELLRAINPKIDWYSYEEQTEKNENCEEYLIGQEFIDQGKGVLVDQNERYWITLGPKVFNPVYPDNGKCEADEFKNFIGCRVDVVLQHMEDENKHIYIECVWSGNIKAHTFGNGIFQTGYPYENSSVADSQPYCEEYVNGSIVEFTGKDPKETGDMSDYIVDYLIVYPKSEE